ncbi:uncharacterized protein C7orf57 homolog [Cyprinodon tularosa]|uniref:uncharacterized protein C7orf57 homolog n=1 Tax=Cyprinodon tularosa TaxID=77115 RepID=UPI0018E27E11|nr:uncharacterized protein C7orf57 homolog [Cyprinodon tularosa]XP_038141512.1 uncharacterized protein C7orf57 homolog [Cyprinodon tularosa]
MVTSSQTSKHSGCNSVLFSCKMNSETSLVFSGSDVEPGKSGVRTGYVTQDGHISQIPGLSRTTGSPPEERNRGRRAAVLKSDSDYLKLAKQGGHKELLWYDEANACKQNAYKPPDWFSMDSGDPSPISNQNKRPGAYLPQEAPFLSDNMSAWERDRDSGTGKEKTPDANYNQMEESQNPNQYGSKYKKIMFDKKPAPVDMAKLLSFGYAEDREPKQ